MSKRRCLGVCLYICVCVLKQSIDHHGKGASLILFFSYLRTCWTSTTTTIDTICFRWWQCSYIYVSLYSYLHGRIQKLRVYWTIFFEYSDIVRVYSDNKRIAICEMLMQLKIRWEIMIGIWRDWWCCYYEPEKYDRLIWSIQILSLVTLKKWSFEVVFYGRINSPEIECTRRTQKISSDVFFFNLAHYVHW